MVPEQRVLRSYKNMDKPEGFPFEFRKFASYGKQIGRPGRPTYFYSEVWNIDFWKKLPSLQDLFFQDVLKEYLGIKILNRGEISVEVGK